MDKTKRPNNRISKVGPLAGRKCYRDRVRGFEHWNLKFIWDLDFGIFEVGRFIWQT
jgi:hypothetical protein